MNYLQFLEEQEENINVPPQDMLMEQQEVQVQAKHILVMN